MKRASEDTQANIKYRKEMEKGECRDIITKKKTADQMSINFEMAGVGRSGDGSGSGMPIFDPGFFTL